MSAIRRRDGDRALNSVAWVFLAVLYHYSPADRGRILEALSLAVVEL